MDLYFYAGQSIASQKVGRHLPEYGRVGGTNVSAGSYFFKEDYCPIAATSTANASTTITLQLLLLLYCRLISVFGP